MHTVILIGNLQKNVLKMNGKIVPPVRDIINSLDFYLFYNYKLVDYIHWTKE